MFSPKVILWGGVAGVFSGMLWIMGIAPSSGGAAVVLALVLGLGGLVSLYSRQAGQGGRLGLAGFALGIIGTVLALATAWWGFTSGRLSNMEREPVLAAPAVLISSLALIILGIGLALLGVTSFRAKTLPRWRGLPLGLGLLSTIQGMTIWLVHYVPLSQGRVPWDPWNFGFYVLYPTVLVLLGIGWMGLGFMLATEAETKIAQSPPASA